MIAISAEIYGAIFLLLVILLTIWIITKRLYIFPQNGIVLPYDKSSPIPWNWIIIPSCFAIFIGMRPESGVFVDMMNYVNLWGYRVNNSLGWDAENFIFDNIPYFLNKYGFSRHTFFLLISIIYFVGTAYACKRMFGRNWLIAYVVWLGAFSTFSYSVNGIKAGSAASIFLIALSLADNKKLAIPIVLLSLGFHHSMILPIGAFFFCMFIKNPKYILAFWIICLIISFANITSIMEWIGNFIADNGDRHGAAYLLGEQENLKKGFRPDFLLYSSIPVALGYWAIKKRQLQNKTYIFIWSIYVVCNAFWLLCMYASFTNRIAYLSWFMYPIVLIYPFLQEKFIPNQSSMIRRILALNLMFTLFMYFVYYA